MHPYYFIRPQIRVLSGCYPYTLQVAPISGKERTALEKDAAALKQKEEAEARKGTATGWLMKLPLRLASSVAGHYYTLATAPLLAIPFVGWTAYFLLNGQAQGGREASELMPKTLHA